MSQFCISDEKEEWYYRINPCQVKADGKEDAFLCWDRNCYKEKELVGWNLRKIPLVRINGVTRKITHREMARLKGFPDEFAFTLRNKEWLYRKMVYSANVQMVAQLAESVNDIMRENPLRKLQEENGLKFEELFGRYLQKKGTDMWTEKGPGIDVDYICTLNSGKICFEVKFFGSDFGLNQKLRRVCERSQKLNSASADIFVLVVGNIVNDGIKEASKKQYGIYIWDVRNLLWIFDEFQEIKNEFIAFLNYSVENIQPEAPEPDIVDAEPKNVENNFWKEKLSGIKAGREHFQEYEEVCIKILKYVLGEFLTLWERQETTRDGLYRFDLCCKIKNGTDQDFFDTIRNYFHTKYIVFEFKNYSGKITQKEIYTTEKYLYEKALRRVAVIISREGADDNALTAARGCLRESGKLILCLSDNDLRDLIEIKERGEQSTAEYFEAMMDDLLIHLEK